VQEYWDDLPRNGKVAMASEKRREFDLTTTTGDCSLRCETGCKQRWLYWDFYLDLRLQQLKNELECQVGLELSEKTLRTQRTLPSLDSGCFPWRRSNAYVLHSRSGFVGRNSTTVKTVVHYRGLCSSRSAATNTR